VINRYAIIIEASNVKNQDFLPGARLDARNWYSFLTSDLGGAWNDNEICVLSQPSSYAIRRLLLQHSRDYVFLAFSGHGFEEYSFSSRKYVTKICLNDSEQAVAIDAITPTQLGTSIFDCCRGIEREQGNFSLANESLIANRDSPIANTKQAASELFYRIERRKIIKGRFLKNIEMMQVNAPVRMYSCSRNEGAGEDPAVGGFYTTLLIKGARYWAEGQRNSQYYDIYTTKNAHDYAKAAMALLAPQQNPEYTPFGQSYPFAVG